MEGHQSPPPQKKSYKHEEKIPIKLQPGDENSEILQQSKIDIIKVDVEGHETEVILGLKNTIQKHKPIIILEWNCERTRSGFQKHDIFNTILSGYCKLTFTTKYDMIKNLTRKNKLMNPFRSVVWLLYKLFTTKKHRNRIMILDDFKTNKDYASIILSPSNNL